MKELVLKYALLTGKEKSEVLIFMDFLLAKRKQTAKQHPKRKTLPKVSVWETDDFLTIIRQNDRTLMAW